MNKISLAINAVLTVAVVVLYVMQFQGEEKNVAEPQIVEEVIEVIEEPVIIADSGAVIEEVFEEVIVNQSVNKVAFVDFDRVNVEWKYFQRETKRIEAAHMGDLQRVQDDKKKLEQDYVTYMQSLQQGGIQDPSKEQYIQKEQARIAEREQQLMSVTQDEVFKANTDGMKKMKKVLKEYAIQNGYSSVIATGLNIGSPVLYHEETNNITDEILKILNNKHK